MIKESETPNLKILSFSKEELRSTDSEELVPDHTVVECVAPHVS